MAHEHKIVDTEAHFSVDATTREITNADKLPALVQNDHNSERFTFVVPRYVDSHDMSLCEKVEVLYCNIQSSDKTQNFGRYIVSDLAVNPDDENTVILTWIISDDATQYVGSLIFSLRFYCKSNYIWNTRIFEKTKIEKGMPKTDDSIEEEISLEPFIESMLNFFEDYNNTTEETNERGDENVTE